MSVIEIRNITKDYGSNKGVFDVSFGVEKGECMGYLGPNSAGKTTTIRHLVGFIKPDSGSVRINGRDCFKEADKIQRDLGYLPGETAFMDDMTGMEFINFIAGLKGLQDMTRAKELTTLFELDTSGRIKKMSKGMKQKLAIVVAFMHDPSVLILDEPTSGLDPLMKSKFIQMIQKEKLRGTTILMSSHTFEEVERTCDRVAIIKQGKIVAVEAMDGLRKSKRKLFELRFASPADAKRFKAAHPDSEIDGEWVQITVESEINTFIKAIAEYDLSDINMRVQALEEMFLHFYGGDMQ